MSCSCHGKKGEIVKSMVKPFDQCTACARKHVNLAWSLWNEFTYEEDNRDYVSVQLRNAVNHLMFTYRETALKLRDLAVIIEENRDAEYQSISERLDALKVETRNLFYKDHPEALSRLQDLRQKTERK